MEDNLKKIVGQRINLVCFAEYSCFIHFDGDDHARFENKTEVQTPAGNYQIFPRMEHQAIRVLLGSEVNSINICKSSVQIDTSGGNLVTHPEEGYESVMLVIGGITWVR